MREIEPDAALGNGGLGRLAACFLDSMATLGVPGYGYGIRYEYGMFHQGIEDGQQVEHPDNWLRYGNPWEFPRPEVLYQVKFHGRVVEFADEHGRKRHQWVDTDDVMAMAYDYPIPGYDTGTVNNMRLWAAKASARLRPQVFQRRRLHRARWRTRTIPRTCPRCSIPNDTTEMGRELRLKQQYFFVCASLQDMLYRFAKSDVPLDSLPDKVAIQLNDTHPSIAVAELMRILIDLHRMEWARAWDITTRTFAYTNHTLMPEALETWPVPLFERVLPRHLQIIYEINHRFLKDVMHHYPGDPGAVAAHVADRRDGRASASAWRTWPSSAATRSTASPRFIRDLMKETIFADFHRLWPDKIVNMTNGVTPRRWLNQANPGLSKLITQPYRQVAGSRISTSCGGSRRWRTTPAFAPRSSRVKRDNKARLAQLHRAAPVNSASIPIRCSTCRSSASTNTSASCSTCCTSSRSTTACAPAATRRRAR